MKFLLISPKNRTVYNFRGDLIKEIINKGYEVVVTGPNEENVEKILELGARFIVVPMNKTGTSFFGDLRYYKELVKIIKKEKPDVTLGYTIKPVAYGALAASRSGVQNINCLITGAGYTFIAKSAKARIIGLIVRILYRIGLYKANHVIFQNRDDQSEFCQRKLVRKSKTAVVNGSGVNLDIFTQSPLPETTTFLMISRFLKSKGIIEYLEAAKIVKEKYPHIKFYLLGKYETAMQDAVPQDFIEKFINSGIVERFEETKDVRPYYEMCSVYVLPSYREGTPRTVLEAMASGRPIVTADSPGCRETTIDGKNGFLVPVKDSQALAEKMEWFIEHPERIAEMGKESRRYVEEKFDVRKVNSEMIRLMDI